MLANQPQLRIWGAALAVAILFAVGCGGAPTKRTDRAYAKGDVTLNGQPLAAGTISFTKLDGSTSTAVPISEGKYLCDSAPVGECKVTVDVQSIPGGPGPVKIPTKYSDPLQSELRATFEPGQNEYDVAME